MNRRIDTKVRHWLADSMSGASPSFAELALPLHLLDRYEILAVPESFDVAGRAFEGSQGLSREGSVRGLEDFLSTAPFDYESVLVEDDLGYGDPADGPFGQVTRSRNFGDCGFWTGDRIAYLGSRQTPAQTAELTEFGSSGYPLNAIISAFAMSELEARPGEQLSAADRLGIAEGAVGCLVSVFDGEAFLAAWRDVRRLDPRPPRFSREAV